MFLLLYERICSVSFSPRAMGWPVVCDCGITWSYYLVFDLHSVDTFYIL